MPDYSFNLTTLPTVSEASIGSSDTLSVLSKVKNALNLANARALTTHVSQSYPASPEAGAFVMNNGASGVDQAALQWRIPYLGSGFGNYTIKILATSEHGVGPLLKFTNASGDVITHQLVAGGAGQPAIGAVQEITINNFPVSAAAAASWYDEVSFSYQSQTNVQVGHLLKVEIYQQPKTSPLSSGVTGRPAASPGDTAELAQIPSEQQPIGGDSIQTGYSLSAFLGKALIDTMIAIDQRPRVVQCWSARTDTQNAVLAAQQAHENLTCFALPVVRQSTQGQSLTVLLRAANTHATKQGRVVFVSENPSNGDDLGGRRVASFTIPANTAAAWYSAALSVNDENKIRQSTAHSTAVGRQPNPQLDANNFAGFDDLQVVAFSIWGST